jgi:RibD C-terminal domain
MGKIVMSEFVSLDGVIQDPDGNEGFRVGGWVGQLKDREELYAVKLGEALDTEALLLYVVSSTLQDPDWNNSTVLKSDVVNEVSKLKQEVAGDIVVYASFQLLRTLIEHDLVDELRLMVLPVVLGTGERLFGETSDKKPMRLVDTRTVDDDIAFLTYEPVREA